MIPQTRARERGAGRARPTGAGPHVPWRPYRAALDDAGRRLYDRIAEALCAHEGVIPLDAAAGTPYETDTAKLERLLGELRREVPEVDFASMAVARRASRLAGGAASAVRLEVGYADDAALAARNLRTMEDRARRAIAATRVRTQGQDHLTALCLHDWLLERCTYEKGAPHAHDAVGALVLGRAVCDGIAKAYKFLCDRAGIPCALVTGYDRVSGGRHAWNALYVAGRWSHVDPTDDLPARAGDRPSRAYFGLSDEEVLRGRSIDPGCPACPQGLGYFESIGMVADGASELGRLVGRMLTRDALSFEVKLAGPLAYGPDADAGAPAAHEALEKACAGHGVRACGATLQGMDVALVDIGEGRAL